MYDTKKKDLNFFVANTYYSLNHWEGTNLSPIEAIYDHYLEINGLAKKFKTYKNLFNGRRNMDPPVFNINKFMHILIHGTIGGDIYDYLYPWRVEDDLPREIRALQIKLPGKSIIEWFGHSHIPAFIQYNKDVKIINSVKVKHNIIYPIEPGVCLINPGSVGQPRDLDHRAAYAIFNSEENTVIF